MEKERVLHEYLAGDADRRMGLFLFHRELREDFSRIEDRESSAESAAGRTGNETGQMLLRLGFLIGALTDAAAVIPMLHPGAAGALFGSNAARSGVEYRYAMAVGASLMAGWALLLLWGYRRPVERRGLLLITLFAVAGITASTVYGALNGVILFSRAVPLWTHLGLLSSLFVSGVALNSGRKGNPRAGQADPPLLR